ncbi:hypothetical protein [Rhodococcus sp. ZPP]|uniref:hypothetical protein n=1 Tax=Rhodococcus sp. ZPP TaxID=2749906 RepID=UPI001FCBFCE3|nr:hypothetical protein [Rhodococcus sp. ZPP]
MHGVVRYAANKAAQRGDLQAILVADPSTRANPRQVFEQIWASGSPEHTRYRKLVASVFTPRTVARMRVMVQERADRLLDELVELGVRSISSASIARSFLSL